MIDRQKRGRLMATARQNLQNAFEAVKEVSDMYGARMRTWLTCICE